MVLEECWKTALDVAVGSQSSQELLIEWVYPDWSYSCSVVRTAGPSHLECRYYVATRKPVHRIPDSGSSVGWIAMRRVGQ